MRIRLKIIPVIVITLAAACTRQESGARGADASNKTQTVLTWTLQTSMSDADLSAIAARRAYSPETRALAQQIASDQAALHADLARIAQQRGIATAAVEERRRALKENLLTLPGQVFDRGFTLAIAQDSGWMLLAFDRASSDPAMKALAVRYRPLMAQEQKASNQILDRLGGSPFGYAPGEGAPPPF